ncbi:hypothetical protein [Abyssogena phaseoliformis symbiont]|uniref:hypothetical protein n=1 Tax=Abyssogena phaseoliformis symbiont TaxID=596095 RepID=UPI00191627ED|nr:hypothetical protein [Abyssogena phaseoliformis symbiont]
MDDGELQTLTSLGISSINLTTDGAQQTLSDGNIVYGQTQYSKTDGTSGIVADVSFSYKTHGYKMIQTQYGFKFVLEPGSTERTSYFHNSNTKPMHLDLVQGNYDIATGNNGDDTQDASQADYAVLLSGGADDDVLSVDNEDMLDSMHIQGGSGYDKLVIVGGGARDIDADALGIESVVVVKTLSMLHIMGGDDVINSGAG